MTSRDKENPDVTRRRDALLEALRSSGDTTAWVAQRARRLLQLAPAQVNSMAWLQAQLPSYWHFSQTVQALQATRGAARTPPQNTTKPPHPRRRRPRR